MAHIVLTPNKEHRKVFGDKPPVIGWRKPRSLKDHLVSAKAKCEPSSDNKSVPCCRSRCQICPFIEETQTFQKTIPDILEKIRKRGDISSNILM